MPPTVASTEPEDGAADVSVNAAIHATFSEAMKSSTININTFKLSGGITGELTLQKKQRGDTVVTVTGDNGCLAEGIMVKATIVSGKNFISVLPDSQKTNADGEAAFTIKAKNRDGTVKVRFKATGLPQSVVVTVTVQS